MDPLVPDLLDVGQDHVEVLVVGRGDAQELLVVPEGDHDGGAVGQGAAEEAGKKGWLNKNGYLTTRFNDFPKPKVAA